MAYFEDLSVYSYHRGMFYRPGTKNIGWLALGHEFNIAQPSEEVLERLWAYCKVSVAQMRGVHRCEFCPPGEWHVAERKGGRLLLSTSEIRVFSEHGDIFAAPTLIYHYVHTHHYNPPDVFIGALMQTPAPPAPEYFARLEELGLEWNETSVPDQNSVPFRFSPRKDT